MRSADTADSEWIPTAEAAEFLGVRPRSVTRYCAAGLLRHRRRGLRAIEVSLDAVRVWRSPRGGTTTTTNEE